MSQTIATLSDAEFASTVLSNPQPTLVDFWAEWCTPCRALTPIMEEVAKSYAGRLNVGKMNVEDNPNTAGQYGIRSVPTLLLFKNGMVVDQMVGLVPKAKIDEMLSRHL